MSQNAWYQTFGSGILLAKPLATNGQPIAFGALQDVSLEMSGTNKQLFGQNQFPLAVARGELKLSGKAKVGQICGPLYSSLFFSGASTSSGTTSLAYGEAHTVPAVTTYTITVTNSATFVEDLGVVYAATGIPLTPVTSGPTQGQYSYAAGVYTFAAADASAAVSINYTYTQSTVGSTIQVGNPLQGVQPIFEIMLQRSFNGVGERYKLYSCISGKLTLPTKMADWGISEFDFDCFANVAGKVIDIYTDV